MSIALAAALAAASAPSCAITPRTSLQDRNAMLATLGISSTRPGKSGTIGDPNQANNDENLAVFSSPMPDALKLSSGVPVTSAAQWKQRRAELIRLEEEHVYGRVPLEVPNVTWSVTSSSRITVGAVSAIDKRLKGTVTSTRCPALTVSFNVRLITPENAPAKVPVVLSFSFVFPGAPPAPPSASSLTGQLLAAGIGNAILDPTELQPDSGAGFTQGIIGITNEGRPRAPNEWGVLRAWAWGASRTLDYLIQDPAVDGQRVALEGLSRYGKATLVAMAFDTRFAGALAGSSGEAGASPYRRNFGETLENVAGTGEYHWMAGNFMKYAGPLTADDLPVDANSLIALSAPRPLMIGAGNLSQDWWVDPKGSFLAADASDEVWSLLGSAGLGTSVWPDTGVLAGTVGIVYLRHTAGHTSTPNYPAFVAFSKQTWAK